MSKQWLATAPSNLALIKYMGKIDASQNLPSNPSLSITLPNLISTVRLQITEDDCDTWQPLNPAFSLNDAGQMRFLSHLQSLKKQFGCLHHFRVESDNNFPAACGLASSASSFAALTRVAIMAFQDLNLVPESFSDTEIAALARTGSGSACRSLFSPWALWDAEDITKPDLPDLQLEVVSIVVDASSKVISSSEAHQRVQTSPTYPGREARARTRLTALINTINDADWTASFNLIWEDCLDMHNLFATAAPAFQYLTLASWKVIETVLAHWDATGDGPWMTCDAGPTVHLLFRPDQAQMKAALLDAVNIYGQVVDA